MAAHRNPDWTRAEIAVLREHYPNGGLKAVLEHLPHRSWHGIHMKAQKLGIRCDMTKVNGGRRCKLAGEHLQQAICLREKGWSFAKIGAHLGYAECTVSNAVLIAQCLAQGYTPADRSPNGRLTAAGHERLRWMLKKGLKGVEIQLRLGVSASTVAEQRRRYNAELKGKGKAPLPPPGGGVAYSGARISKDKKREAERLFLEGFGTKKVSERTGVSKTVCVRIRAKLVQRLKRKGQCLPGCDLDGKRHVMRDHARSIPEELKLRFRDLLMLRVPVRRAAKTCGIGTCSAYRIRDAIKAEIGDALPPPKLPGKSKVVSFHQVIPDGWLWRFRQLVREHGDTEARRLLRAEIAEAKQKRTFEERLEALRRGEGRIEAAFVPRRRGPDYTLGGIATGAL